MLLNLIELIKKYNMKIKGVIQIGLEEHGEMDFL
jgi:hypothetical protein